MCDQVECHSGYEYAQRPMAINWQGERHQIKTIIAQWRNPEGLGFRVELMNGSLFQLFYNQGTDTWEIIEC